MAFIANQQTTRDKNMLGMKLQALLYGVIVTAFYALALWRVVTTNRGNRVIECGVISLILVFAEGIAGRSGAPDWFLESFGILLLLMCFLTVALFARECYQEIRRRLGKSGNPGF
jgi:hypothetical protein